MQRPALNLKITTDSGEERTVKMSYGLFNDLQRVVPDPSAVIDIVSRDPISRDYLVRRVFTDKKGMVTKEEELISPENMPVDDPVEIEKVLIWVTEHLMYFFGTSAGRLKKMGQEFRVAVGETEAPSAPSTGGSQD